MKEILQKSEKDPEIISAERICEEMREIAKKLPKPENRKREKEEVEQFGNNFLFLFSDHKNINKHTGSKFEGKNLGKMEKLYGEKWKKFLEENTDLVAWIQEILKSLELYNRLFENFMKLINNSKTGNLAIQMEKELNLVRIRADIWNKLNPLLKQASEAMTLYGIKPEDFYG